MTDVVRTLELVPLASLIPHARNANKHPEAQVAELAGMIREFGFNVPIVVRADNTILAGHGRFLAAQRLGLEVVPVVRATHLDADTKARAFMHSDNRAPRLAEIDEEMLRIELSDLSDLGVDLGVMGYSDDELAKMFPTDGVDGGGGGGDDGGSKYGNQFGVIVICENENKQQEVYERLVKDGYNCKVVVT